MPQPPEAAFGDQFTGLAGDKKKQVYAPDYQLPGLTINTWRTEQNT